MRTGQLQLVTSHRIAIDCKLHAFGLYLTEAVINRYGASRARENGKCSVRIGSIDIACRVGPIVVTGAVLPGTVATIDGAIELRTDIAVPEIEIRTARKKVDLSCHSGLDCTGTVWQHADIQAIIGEGACVVYQAIDTWTVATTRCFCDIQRPIECEIALDLNQVVQCSARHTGLSELHGQDGTSTQCKAAVDGQRSCAVAAGGEGAIGDDHVTADNA